MELSRVPSRFNRRRRAFALVALAVAVAASIASFGLAATGSGELKIEPLPGSVGGAAATVTGMSSKVTRSKGAAQLDAGVALARIDVAHEAADHIKLSVSWTNVQEAPSFLTKPKVQLSIGLYHPVHSGVCTSEDTKNNEGKEEVVAPYVTIEDTNAETVCATLDKESKGSFSVSEEGKLLLTPELVGGYLEPHLAGKDELPECKAEAVEWCHTKTSPSVHSDPLYLVASIVTPGGTSQGQQEAAGSLKFFLSAKQLQ